MTTELAVLAVAELGRRQETLATAESLTGGLIGAAITAVPGASTVYLGGVISYATAMKAVLAGADSELLARHGPVSAWTARALADGVRTATGADWALAATGVAGPGPQDGHDPGEVWLALAGPGRLTQATRHDFTGNREAIRAQTVAAGLALLAAALR